MSMDEPLPYSLVLFGAGASRGAGSVAPDLPPLGRELFEALVSEFPGSWGCLPAGLPHLFRQDFELGMEVLWDKWSAVVPVLMQHMALYFLQFHPAKMGQTLYGRLAAMIARSADRRRVVLSTLNYDCLLEIELAGAGVPIDLWGHATHESVRLMKLHGSANFIPEGLTVTRGVQFTRGVLFDTSVRGCDLNEATAFCLGDNALPPVMCLYMKDKPVSVGREAISRVQSDWLEAVRHASKVVIVGVHPNPQDRHLWSELANCTAPLRYVGDQSAFLTWANSTDTPGDRSWIAATFATGFDGIMKELDT